MNMKDVTWKVSKEKASRTFVGVRHFEKNTMNCRKKRFRASRSGYRSWRIVIQNQIRKTRTQMKRMNREEKGGSEAPNSTQ